MAQGEKSQVFECSFGAGGEATAAVVSFTGREQISRPFRFDVTVAVPSRHATRFPADVLGGAFELRLSTETTARRVRGIVSRVALAEIDAERHLSRYVVRVVPRLWALSARKNSRIFQDKTVPQIVTEVLDGAGIAHAWRVGGNHGVRPYSVQYQETDLDYVTRLLAEEGIFYFFEDPTDADDTELVVFADLAAHYPAIEGDIRLPFAPPSGLERPLDVVEAFVAREQLRSGAARVKNFDFRRPDTELSSSEAAKPRPRFDEGALEVYEYDFAAEDDAAVAVAAARRLEQLRVRRQVGVGRTRCRRLAPGRRFALEGHPEDAVNREYVVVKTSHEGRHPESTFGAASGAAFEVYKNDFECLPADVAARPPRRSHRMQQVLETATVVGPGGEEIHTDEHGRIKVQFHWDRAGRRDEHSSCWIRCMQTWAGASWGFQFVPRIGMEVLVTFVGGDVDQPMVIGCANNGTHPPPFPLPASKTQSGIRTRSTPGGEGSNELSFEDAAGKEQVYLHAQRDLQTVVEHDELRVVRGDDQLLVQGSCESIVDGDHYRTVRGNEVISIEKDLVLHIVGRQRIVVEGRAPSGGGEGGGGEGDVPPAPPAAPESPRAPAIAAEPLTMPVVDTELQALDQAKLVWAMASLPADLQAHGARIEKRAGEVAVRTAALRWEIGTWLAAGRPPSDVQALRARTTEARAAVLEAMVDVGMAVDARMAKVRDAAQQQLIFGLVETQRAQIALAGEDPSRVALPTRGGSGRGGGGAVVPKEGKPIQFKMGSGEKYSETNVKDGSELVFETGGKIKAKDGFMIEVDTTKLTMTPAGIELDAPFISLHSKGDIAITAVGNVYVNGAIIKLN